MPCCARRRSRRDLLGFFLGTAISWFSDRRCLRAHEEVRAGHRLARRVHHGAGGGATFLLARARVQGRAGLPEPLEGSVMRRSLLIVAATLAATAAATLGPA